MQPAGKIPVQQWMKQEALGAVLDALAAAGIEARLVGGCVRNALLARAIEDVDIAVAAPPEAVVAALAKAQLKAVPTGIEHGTVTAVADGRPFEITSLRRDVETDGRHAKVAFTGDWLQDAERRDFTFNAMYLDADGTLYDPFAGQADLAAGRVRFVGDAQARIGEDYLRVFRFFRFFAWYGRPPMDDAALSACKAARGQLDRLSAERVQKEMLKLLAAPDPAPAVAAMIENGILAHWLPEAGDNKILAALAAVEAGLGIKTNPIGRLASLLADADQARTVAGRWKLSRQDSERLAALTIADDEFGQMRDRPGLMRALYRHGFDLLSDRASLIAARARAGNDEAATLAAFAALTQATGLKRPVFPLRGADALALGLAAGPAVGQLLRAVEEWWIAGDFEADRDACLAELKKRAVAARP